MATITTKYSIGDIVFFASTTVVQKQHPCPDCLGSRHWKATSPAGQDYDIACPRCSARYSSNDDLSLTYSASTPTVRRLTVGSVQYNSEKSGWDAGARYMCVETGVGSGSVYGENDLYPSEEEAQRQAEIKAALANSNTEWIAKRYDRTLYLSDYQFSNALTKAADDAKRRASSMIWHLEELFEKINEADDKDAILEAVDDYKRWDWEGDKAAASKEAA